MAWGKPKQNRTGAEIVAEAEALGKTLKRSERGVRELVRSTLQTVQTTFEEMRADIKLQQRFLRRLRARDIKQKEDKVNLELEFMTIVTGNSRRGRQRASKYCKVLRILEKDGVGWQRIAEEIKIRGGIENIVGRKKSPAATARKDQDQAETETNTRLQPHQLVNDQEVRCAIVMKQSDREKIFKTPVGATMTLEVLRIGQRNAELKLRRIHAGSAEALADDEIDEEDW